MMNKRGQLEFDETQIMPIILGVIGGFIALIVSGKAGASFFFKIINFAVVGFLCYLITWKMADSG